MKKDKKLLKRSSSNEMNGKIKIWEILKKYIQYK